MQSQEIALFQVTFKTECLNTNYRQPLLQCDIFDCLRREFSKDGLIFWEVRDEEISCVFDSKLEIRLCLDHCQTSLK